MLPPKIESSCVEERRTWIKSTFQCKADYIEGTKSFEQVAKENRRI